MSVTSWAGCSLGNSLATQSGGLTAVRAAIAFASVPIVKVPAGTQTWSIPNASVRVLAGGLAVGRDRGRGG